MYMNGTPRNPSSPDSSKTAAEIAAMRQVLTRKTEELREGYQAMEEKIAQPFPKEGSDEFKTFVLDSLTAKTLSDILMVVEKYNRIPIKVFESGRIDEVDGKAMKGMIEKYLEDANFTQENTENYSFDINGIKLFKGKLSGLLSEEIEKRVIKNKGGILKEKNVIQINEEVRQENPLPANLPLQPIEALNGVAPDTQTINSLKESKITQPKLKKPGVLRSLLTRASNKLGKWQEKSEAEYANDNRLMRGVITQKEWAEEKRKLENGDSPMEQFEPESSAASNNKETTTKAESGAIKSILKRPPSSKINNDSMVKRSVFGTTSSRLKKIFGKKDKGNKPSEEGAVSVPTFGDEPESILDKTDSILTSLQAGHVEGKAYSKEEIDAFIKRDIEEGKRKRREARLLKLSMEEKKRIENGFANVGKNTEKQRASLLEKLGTNGKELLTLADRGAKFFGENVGWKVKTFAGAGLAVAGAFAAPAAPIVLTAIGVTSLAVRGVSAAGTYLILKGILDKKYEALATEGKTVSDLRKAVFGTGAIILAATAGQLAGYIAEQGLSSLQDIFTEKLPPVSVPVPVVTPDIPTPEFSQPEAPLLATPEAVIVTPEVFHEVIKGQNLWSILRTTLSKENIDGFLSLTQGEQEARIHELVGKIAEDPKSFGIGSGKVGLIRVGETLNITKMLGQ